MPASHVIRVQLPSPLSVLAHVPRNLTVTIAGDVTANAIIDALERDHPRLRNTIRDGSTGQRRPLVRFFACEQDLSHDPMDQPLPDPVARGEQPFIILGAIAGG